MQTKPNHQVKSRQVFYIPGYDPIPPRRYRELYRVESAAQAEVSGYEIGLTARPGTENFGWHVNAKIEGCNVKSEIIVLLWSDIVRKSMNTSIPATFGQLARTTTLYLSTGALWRLSKLRKGPVIAALYPIGMLLVQVFVGVCIALLVARGIAFVGTWALAFLTDPAEAALGATAVSASAALFAFVGTLRWFKRHDGRFFAYYLMHDYAYSASARGANPPELEKRIAQFADRIAKALRSDVDEVLIVGHSSGAHLAVSVLADLIRQGRVPYGGPSLSFLSLGQVVPMVSFLPDAHRLRADLQYLSARNELAWIDVSAPGDGCAFALCDPVAVSGVAPAAQKWPLVFSAAFTQSLSPARWKALRWRFFRLHFQYLCAFDQPKDYDYFQITAGPRTLGARYAGRAASKSRLTYAVNAYTSTAP